MCLGRKNERTVESAWLVGDKRATGNRRIMCLSDLWREVCREWGSAELRADVW